MTIEILREFLGWCLVINCGLMLLGLAKVLGMQEWASERHAKLFGLDPASVRQAYLQYFVNFKIVVIVFNLAPYLALRIMA